MATIFDIFEEMEVGTQEKVWAIGIASTIFVAGLLVGWLLL